MNKKLFILGSGSLALEIVGWLRSDASFQMSISGFIDPYANADVIQGLPIHKEFNCVEGNLFILGIAKPEWREEFADAAIACGGIPFSYIHPTVIISDRFKYSPGLFIAPYSTVSCDVLLAKFVHMNVRTSIGHDCSVGDYSILLGGNLVNGNVLIGRLVTIGSGAVIRPGKKIFDDATVGIGSVVVRNVKSAVTVFGVPAKVISQKL
jgi:sugar O-acyltransferase (sialic acid O-acetyltransferase NeuD family)